MTTPYHHLGIYSDLVDEAQRRGPLFPLAAPGPETQRLVRETLGWCDRPDQPLDVQVERRWEKDGLCGEELTWSAGYGPRTAAWLFKPAGASGPLPGVLALHDHGGFKYYGKEKIAEGPDQPQPCLLKYRENYYGGRPWVNALAQAGFAVLVHDAFLWGSRKFPIQTIKDSLYDTRIRAEDLELAQREALIPPEIAEYNALAGDHEHIVSKYCNLLGAGLPGVVCFEDRVALTVLRSRPDVQPDNLGCMGLSGGGNRAGMLRATVGPEDGLKAAAVIGLMSTYAGLLDHNINHTWMLYPFGWSRLGDWPDLVACRAPAPLLVQYDWEDDLFTPEGMKAAHARLQQHYQSAGAPRCLHRPVLPRPAQVRPANAASCFCLAQSTVVRGQMSIFKNPPTPYPDVNAILADLLANVQEIFGDQFIGMYLDGSLTSGDFDQDSDIDFLAVTSGPISEADFLALQAMHQRFIEFDLPWGIQLEGSYMSQHALRRCDPADDYYPNMERGREERLKWVHHDQAWNIHRWVVRERGITLAGPAPQTLIDPVPPADLRQAMEPLMSGWLPQILADPARVNSRGYQSYVVLTLCRIFYTMQTSAVASKPTAVRWAKENLDGRWRPLIDQAWADRHRPDSDPNPKDLNETLEMIRFLLGRDQG